MKRLTLHRALLLVYAAVALAAMTAIFIFSSQPGESSVEVSRKVLESLKSSGANNMLTPEIAFGKKDADKADGEKEKFSFNLSGRKWGHFYLYALLGAAVFLFMRELLKGREARLKRLKILALSFGVCLAYACSDEFHQRFVEGRSALVSDLMYDSLGFGISILLALAATWGVELLIKIKRSKEKIK